MRLIGLEQSITTAAQRHKVSHCGGPRAEYVSESLAAADVLEDKP